VAQLIVIGAIIVVFVALVTQPSVPILLVRRVLKTIAVPDPTFLGIQIIFLRVVICRIIFRCSQNDTVSNLSKTKAANEDG